MENIDITLQEYNVSNVNSVLTGPQGPQGEPGTPGQDGVSPTVNVGTTTTLPAGSQATVVNSGSESNVILDFSIPQGAKGDPGDPGAPGQDGTDGVSPTVTVGTTYTLPAGSYATVENVGTDTDLILNFSIPRGDEGDVSGCLTAPLVVEELPETAVPGTFYFVPKTYTDTTVTGDNITLTISDNAGRIDTLTIKGYLDESDMSVLSGDIDIDVDGDTVTVHLDSTYLADVNGTYDEITNDGNTWNLIRRIGYIESYDGETITTDYVSTSGTLTTGDEVYYVLDTEETIEIVNEDIVNPLNIVRATTYEQGTVTITTTADVTANLIVAYHSFDIHNQYDKYVYIIETSNYERIE